MRNMKTKNPTHLNFAIAACTFGVGQSITADDEIIMQLTPSGIFKPSDNRPLKVAHWHINQSLAALVIERFNARTQPVVVDYEHQTLNKETNGQPAPAAGWMKELMWREEGLFARVKLTKPARTFIENAEYRFVSPVFRYAANGDVTEIEMAALTNDPGIHGMQALELRAAATFGYHETEEPPMKLLTALITALALPLTTTEDEAVAALTAHTAKDPLKPMRDALGLPAQTGEADLVAACTALKSKAVDPTQFVPISVVNDLRGEIAVLTKRVNTADEQTIAEEIDGALSDGRLHTSMKSWAEDLAKTDRAALTRFLKEQPSLAALTSSQTDGKKPKADAATGLTEDEMAVCTRMGITADEFKKAKAE